MELDDKMGGSPVQCRVVEGKEPLHFRRLFKGKMIIHHGGVPSAYRKTGAFESKEDNESGQTRMYAVHGATPLSTIAHQIQATASNLNSSDCFVVLNSTQCFVFNGKFSTPDEKSVAKNAANILSKGRPIVVVEEGSEPDTFWKSLGGKTDYLKHGFEEEAAREPRLFICSTEAGKFTVEEIDDYNQSDLDQEAVMLLDTYEQVFVWVGFHASAEEESRALDFAKSYVIASAKKDHRHPGTPVIRIESGHEPTLFKRYFIDWDDEFFKRHVFVDPYEAKLTKMKAAKAAAEDELDAPEKPDKSVIPAATGTFPYSALIAGVPPGVDPELKETYLSDTEFNEVFRMTKAAFSALPRWKRDAKKKEVSLF